MDVSGPSCGRISESIHVCCRELTVNLRFISFRLPYIGMCDLEFAATVKPEVAHELQKETKVTFENLKSSSHYSSRSKNGGDAECVLRIHDIYLEKRRVGGVESVEVDAFDDVYRADVASTISFRVTAE